MSQITPRRLPLAGRTSLGNAASNKNSPGSSEASDSRDLARKAALNSLTANLPAPKRPSLGAPERGMDGNQEMAGEVGNTVEVPGGMIGVVKYIGSVKGKAGVFAGVELSKEYAARGKNDGDVDGVRYFTTSVPGAGIFLPAYRAIKQTAPPLLAESSPLTPSTPSLTNFDINKKTNGDVRTPLPVLAPKFSQSLAFAKRPDFSQSLGPGAPAPSPQQLRPKSRPSLPRPESPLRRPPSLKPTPAGLSQSVRGGRPPQLSPAHARFNQTVRTPVAPRSQSRSESRSQSRLDDNDTTPTAASRGTSAARAPPAQRIDNAILLKKLGERDNQLKEQAANLAGMEVSLAELQILLAQKAANSAEAAADGANNAQLRDTIREKNEKIAMLTAEFDSHRADFRSTIDTLEMASTETERVYEKRVEELLTEQEELHKENAELRDRGEDVETVAQQLKMLEELVQELEEGLEDARRGEAEARTEVEFLRGEVERGRSELRREKEKSASALKDEGTAVGRTSMSPGRLREVEQRDDEIRGLKAIIHSLSSGPDVGSPRVEQRESLDNADKQELARLRTTMEDMRHETDELQGMVNRKMSQVDELQQQLREKGRAGLQNGNIHPATTDTSQAIRDSRHSITSTKTAVLNGHFSSETLPNFPTPPAAGPHHAKYLSVGATADDGLSASEASTDTLWCEICETAGHDVLTCSSVFATKDEPEAQLPQTANYKEVLDTQGFVKKTETTSKPVDPPLPSTPLVDGAPAAGKKTRVIDMTKWCALCERDGHESVDCPFEEEF